MAKESSVTDRYSIENATTLIFAALFYRFKSLPPALQEAAVDMMAVMRSKDSDEDVRNAAKATLISILHDPDIIP